MFWVVNATGQSMRQCALLNAVQNVYLENWEAWVMQQTKYCNSVTMTLVLGRKINKQMGTHEADAARHDADYSR